MSRAGDVPSDAAGLGGACVVVTGAAGFIGRRVCSALEQRGAAVITIDRHNVDLTRPAAVRSALGGVRECRVVHLAAVRPHGGTLEDYRNAFETNVVGLLNLLDGLQGRCSRLVTLGTSEEWGAVSVPFSPAQREAPTTPYGVSKLAATHLVEALVRRGEMSAVVLRPTVVYGPGQRGPMFVPSIVGALLAGRRFPMSAGDQTRDFVHVDDVVAAILRALVVPSIPSTPLPVSSGVPIRIRDVALAVAGIVGRGAEGLIDFGATPYRANEPMSYWADNGATRAALAWAPTVPLDEGLRRTVEAWQKLHGCDT